MTFPQANVDSQQPERSAFARSFERAVGRARIFGLIERVWERAAMPVGGVAGLFLTASWLGLWTVASPSLRVAGVALFAAALAAAARPLLGVRMPTRREGIDRMDAKTGIPNRPALTYDSIPAPGTDPEAAALYEMQRLRIEQRVGAFVAGAPQSNLVYRDPYALRLCMLLATIVSGWVAYADDRLLSGPAAAFDWRAEELIRPPVKMDAWVTAPGYTGFAPLYIATAKDSAAHETRQVFSVPQGSVLTLRVHDRHVDVSAEGGAEDAASACGEQGEGQECIFRFSGDSVVTVNTLHDGPLVWEFNILADRPPQITVVAPGTEEQGISAVAPEIRYSITDEYPGSTVARGVIAIPEAGGGESDKRPLPQYDLPLLVIPAPDAR